MRSLWDQGNVSIILFPSRDLYIEVSEQMEKWIADGLIAPSLWVFPEDIEKQELEPARIKAIVCGKDQNGILARVEVDIFDQLARAEFEDVRLIAIRALNQDVSKDVLQAKNLITLSNYVEWSLPLTSARDGDKRFKTKLFKINLIVAPTELHSRDFKTSTEETWDANVIASPEDRSTPWSGDAFVRRDQKYAKFVAMHAASMGALWNGISKSPFEILERENSQRGQYWISRVFVNAILTDGLSRRISADVLKDIANPKSDYFDAQFGVQIKGTYVLDNQQAEAYVDWMVDIVFGLDNNTLSFNNLIDEPEPEKENWYEWTQIKYFLIFGWDKIKVIPWWIWIWFRRLIGKKLTQTFQGKDGKASVGISQVDALDARDRILIEKLNNLLSAEEAAKKALITPYLKRVTKSSAELWTSLRKLVFGMLDGSDLSKFGLTPQDERVPVFSNVAQLIQDPNSKISISDEVQRELNIENINWQNLEIAEEVLQYEIKKLTNLQNELDVNLQETVQLDEKIAEFKKFLPSDEKIEEVVNG